MPFNTNDVPERLIEAVRLNKFVPLIGAGISKQAANELPNWQELLKTLLREAVRKHYLSQTEKAELERLLKRNKYLMAAEDLRNRFPTDEYQTILERAFNTTGVPPSKVHEDLYKLKAPLILTTNYDLLLEDAYAGKFKRAPIIKTHVETPFVQRYVQSNEGYQRPIIFKIHGSINDIKSIVLTESDYGNLIYNQPGYRLFLSAIFMTHVVLMLGFSLGDPELMLLLENIRQSLKHQSHPDYVFLPVDSTGDLERRRLRDDFGVEVIPYTPTPGHPEILELLRYLARKAGQSAESTPTKSAQQSSKKRSSKK